MSGRAGELATSLGEVRTRIARSCAAAGRDPGEVTLVVVTKFFPASDVRLLHGLGVRHVGENRHQEAAAKREELDDLDLTWHFVGGLQSNKAAALGSWADVVQSVDRPRLLPGLAKAAAQRPDGLDVLVQVSLDPPADEQGGGHGSARSGVPPEAAPALARRVADTPGLRLRGVMGVAPRGGDPGTAFDLLAATGRAVAVEVPGATWLSAGMSGDLEQAVAAGATHVRVGTAVLGNRPGPR